MQVNIIFYYKIIHYHFQGIKYSRKLGTNIDEVKHEFKSCSPLKPDNLYWMLFRGVESMYEKLCNSTKPGKSLQSKFSLHKFKMWVIFRILRSTQ